MTDQQPRSDSPHEPNRHGDVSGERGGSNGAAEPLHAAGDLHSSSNGLSNGLSNGHANGHANGHRNGAAPSRQQVALERLHRLEEAVLEARQDREAYRRVLAAAIANEKNAQGRVAETAADRERIDSNLREAMQERGHALGRADELDAMMRKLENQLQDLERTKDRELTSIRERLETEARQELLERAIAQGRIQELETQLARVRPTSWYARRLKTRASVIATVLVYLATVAMLPPVVGLLANRPAAEQWSREDFVTGGAFLACLLLGLGLHTLAVRLLRQDERAPID